MNSESAVAALAKSTRLATVDLLARAEPDGLPAGEIAKQLGVAKNTMSGHLSILSRGGIVSAERQSRTIIYRANMAAIRDLMGYLGTFSSS